MDNLQEPKVLVISSMPMSSTTNNGKTLSSLFEGYNPENIAQLSFTNIGLDMGVCKNHYIITINDVLKKRKGKIVNSVSAPRISDSPKSSGQRIFHFFSQQRLPYPIWIKNKIWDSVDLSGVNDWIDSFHPSIIFFQGFGLSYGYKITRKICEERKLPLLLELTDDYTANLFPASIVNRINQKTYINFFKWAITTAKATIVISPKMKTEYHKVFGGNMVVMMNSINLEQYSQDYARNEHEYIFAGNVLLNRWKVLINFSEALKEFDPHAVLSIYTPDEVDSSILHKFQAQSNISYGGHLNSDELKNRLSHCGYVIHVESFDKKNKKITRLSISTKISEYVACGAKIIAIGPKDIASMEFLETVPHCVSINSIDKNEIRRSLTDSNFKSKDSVRLEDDKFCFFDKSKNRAEINRLLRDYSV